MPINAQKQRKRPRGRPFALGNEYAFKPGTSGNPSGVPRDTPRLGTAYQKLLRAESLKEARAMVENLADVIALGIIQKAAAGDVRAAREVGDRTEGRAPIRIERGAGEPMKVVFEWVDKGLGGEHEELRT